MNTQPSTSTAKTKIAKVPHRPFENGLLNQDGYDPENLLDTVMETFGLKNDAALARKLQVSAPVISKIRNRKLPIGDSMLLRLHDETDISIKELRALMGVAPQVQQS